MNRLTVAILLTAFVALPLGLAVGFVLGIYSTEYGGQLLALVTSSEEPADVAYPQTIERDHFQLKYPGNWTLARNDEYFDIDQYFSIDTAGSSYILFDINRVDTSPKDEVQDSLEYYNKVLQVSKTTSFDVWGNYSGVGVHLIGDFIGTQYEVRIFSHTSGHLSFTVTEFFDAATKEHVKTGYELVETTFVLDSPEDAKGDEELSPLLGQPAPAIELQTVDGGAWSLKDSQGSVVVLDFWATWCGPCVVAMPQLQELHETLKNEPVVIVGVNQAENKDDVTKFIEEKGFTFGQVLDADGSVGSSYGAQTIPQTVVIDAAGTVQAVHVGYSKGLGATLKRQIQKVLEGKDLFDAEQVRKAYEKRMKEVERVHVALGQEHVERLVLVANIDLDGDLYMDSASSNAWFAMPLTGEHALGLNAGGNNILLIEPASNTSRMVTVSWSDDATLWQVRAAPTKNQLRWVTTAYTFNDNYDIEKVHVTVFDESGETVWSNEVPVFSGLPDLSLEAGDFDLDGHSEVVVMANYADTDFGPDFPDVTRVLTFWDDDGTLLVRKWISGAGGSGVHVLSDEQGETILMQTGAGIEQVRLSMTTEETHAATNTAQPQGKSPPE